MPAVPEKQLHANRPGSVPTAHGPDNCYSRTDILTAKTHAAFGSGQSMAVAAAGESREDPETWPKKWPKKGRLLRVPKCVILSSFPFWTLYWPRSYFYFPRAVIGDSGLGFLNNYYYLEQWNGSDPAIDESSPDYSFIQDYDLSDPVVEASLIGSEGYLNNRAWNDMRNLDPADKQGVYNSYRNCLAASQTTEACELLPKYLIEKCPTPPMDERYYQGVATVENPYYQVHPQILDAFLAAKAILESDPIDPIYVALPNWMPRNLYQVRNAALKQAHEKLIQGHGGAPNGSPCQVHDIVPCHDSPPICFAPAYPDVEDPRNSMGFNGPEVPWLLSADPGLGTNVLHLYVGHPNMAYVPTSDMFGYQAWPLSPEVQFIGPISLGTYLGSPLPFFSGRRNLWRVAGFDYGYMVHGAVGLMDTLYGGLVQGAADAYKANFWKFRNFGTRLFTYDVGWGFNWQFRKLDKDRRNDCSATQFYFGQDFEDFQADYVTDDNRVVDCARDGGIKVAETQNYFPSLASIEEAQGVGKVLARRVEDYYNTNDSGSADFFKLAIERNGLADYNVSYEGGMSSLFLDPDAIVAYVRQYFKDNP